MRRVLRIAFVGLFWFAAVMAAGMAQGPDWKTWFEQNAGDFSGVALIAHGDTIESVHAAGIADRSTAAKIAPQTRFNIGSINKTFTALAIAQLIQEGRVSLDDRLAKFLPDYPNADAAAKVTIRQLISHRSGVARFMGGDFGGGTVAEMAQRVGREPQAFEPGARQEYSNGGYVLLGRVVEVVSGKSYEEYVTEKIYRPAGMTNTGFYRPTGKAEYFARGYYTADAHGRPMRGGAELAANPLRAGNPAGGGYSTAEDLFRFARALRTGRLLNAKMTEYALNGTFAEEPKFGFALREQMVGGRRFLGNGGGAPGVNAEFRFEPAGEVTVVVLTNSSPPAATRVLDEMLARIAENAPSAPPAAQTTGRGQQQDDLRREIEALHAEMVAAFQKDPGSVAGHYTRDARILGGGQRISGDDIASYWSRIAGASWQLEVIDAGGARDEPWLLGRSTLAREGAPPMVTDYLAILRRGADGKLRYHIDMFTAARSARTRSSASNR